MGKLGTLFSGWNGRIGRAYFWLGMLTIVIFTVVASALLMAVGQGASSTVAGTKQINGGVMTGFSETVWTVNAGAGFAVSLINAALMLMIGVKRRHDRNFSGVDVVAFVGLSLLCQVLSMMGWLDRSLGTAVPFVLFVWGVCLFVLLGCLRGTTGNNRFGPDPLAPATPVKVPVA